MFKTIDEDDDNRLDAGELLVMVSAAMQTEIGADLQTAKEVLEGARDEFGKFAQVHGNWNCFLFLKKIQIKNWIRVLDVI